MAEENAEFEEIADSDSVSEEEGVCLVLREELGISFCAPGGLLSPSYIMGC